MIQIRPSEERGHATHGWLESWHTFSFAGYYDPRFMGFRDLRVINEDHVQPGRGFAAHSHRDMEIVSIVLEGGLEHEDSLGTGSVIRPGEVQLMRAGRGITHSEFNASPDESLRFLQIWVLPDEEGLEPGYQQAEFPERERRGRLLPVVTPDGREGSLRIHQDVSLLLGSLEEGEGLEHPLAAGRHAWVQLISGSIGLGEHVLGPGDGAALAQEEAVALSARAPSEVLVFDLA